ncbi:MAG TPA: response regulator [Tepidisphaeraceae bacterium]|jgi:signal transduction histidine kinase|nr:response regulator [Tepidisphaeraceae bacterium]
MEPKANILIVDDRAEKLLSLEAVLEDLGETLVTARSGREALRHVLSTDFAVILLDVNMPGMDGFETASLIRQRLRSQHTPIIFITSFGDEMHAARGYQLGAVDYILAPVLPDVLRTKVAVFVDLFKKTEQVRRQADSLERRAGQLQKLAAASLAINAASTMEQMLQAVTDAARDIVEAHQAFTLHLKDGPRAGDEQTVHTLASFSSKYHEWADRKLDLNECARTQVGRTQVPVRLTQDELHRHPDWPLVQRLTLPPIRGLLAAPLLGRDGRRFGLVAITDRFDDAQFSANDEAILVQLTQMASVAIENFIYSKEREANRIKDEFLATLSHELRTPLNAIVGWTQLLQMESLPTETMHGLEVIDRNAKSQAKLIEDLLDVSRITTGKLRLKLQETDLRAIVDAVTETLCPNADAKRIALTIDAGAAPTAPVHGDPDRLQQVVWNLITNAIKFTPSGGRIAVSATVAGGWVNLDVIDSGAGIEPQFLPYVFDRFRQADSTSTRSFGGLGIGLTIVRHIVELHGGTVEARSPGAGQGATFTVRIPVLFPASSVDEPKANLLSNDPNMDANTADANAVDAHAIDAIDEIELTDVTVLVVDDEADARDMVAEMLRRVGARVTVASGVDEAMDLMRICDPAVVISDIAMPVADGFALIRQLRETGAGRFATLPVIALTAYARAEDQARTLAAGFNAHLVKPVDQGAVVSTVARLASQRCAAS